MARRTEYLVLALAIFLYVEAFSWREATLERRRSRLGVKDQRPNCLMVNGAEKCRYGLVADPMTPIMATALTPNESAEFGAQRHLEFVFVNATLGDRRRKCSAAGNVSEGNGSSGYGDKLPDVKCSGNLGTTSSGGSSQRRVCCCESSVEGRYIWSCSQREEHRVLLLISRSTNSSSSSSRMVEVGKIARKTQTQVLCLVEKRRDIEVRNYTRVGGDRRNEVFATYVHKDFEGEPRAEKTCRELRDVWGDGLVPSKTEAIFVIDLHRCNCTKKERSKFEMLLEQPTRILVVGFIMMFFVYIGFPMTVCIFCCWRCRREKKEEAENRQNPLEIEMSEKGEVENRQNPLEIEMSEKGEADNRQNPPERELIRPLMQRVYLAFKKFFKHYLIG